MRKREPVAVERIERGLALLASLMSREVSVYAPLFEKLARDLETMRLKRGDLWLEPKRQRPRARRRSTR